MNGNYPHFAIIAPGINAAAVDPEELKPSETVVLDWMFGEKIPQDMIDTIGAVEEHFKLLEKWLKAARDVLKRKVQEPQEAGQETVTVASRFEAHYIKSWRTDIDRDSVKRDMGQDWYNEHCESTPILTLKVTPRRN